MHVSGRINIQSGLFWASAFELDRVTCCCLDSPLLVAWRGCTIVCPRPSLFLSKLSVHLKFRCFGTSLTDGCAATSHAGRFCWNHGQWNNEQSGQIGRTGKSLANWPWQWRSDGRGSSNCRVASCSSSAYELRGNKLEAAKGNTEMIGALNLSSIQVFSDELVQLVAPKAKGLRAARAGQQYQSRWMLHRWQCRDVSKPLLAATRVGANRGLLGKSQGSFRDFQQSPPCSALVQLFFPTKKIPTSGKEVENLKKKPDLQWQMSLLLEVNYIWTSDDEEIADESFGSPFGLDESKCANRKWKKCPLCLSHYLAPFICHSWIGPHSCWRQYLSSTPKVFHIMMHSSQAKWNVFRWSRH